MTIENKLDEKKEIKEWLTAILFSLIVCTIIFTFIRPAKIHQTSMLPNYKDGEIVLYTPWSELEKKDVVIFEKDKEYYIKRIIGMPGDVVEIKNGNVYVNDKKQDQNYTKDKTTDGNLKCKVPKNEYFVMGDNRLDSLDSRDIGTINKKHIKGEVKIKILKK